MGFDVHVREINSAAGTLSDTETPSLAAGGSPNVGGTPGAALFAGDYNAWLVTRQDDLKAADQQVGVLVAKIRAAAKSYDGDDDNAADIFMKALDGGFARIDR